MSKALMLFRRLMIKNHTQLIFVGGFPSGGTDLLKNILNVHPQINLSGEIQLLPSLLSQRYTADTTFPDVESLEQFRSTLRRIDYWHNFKGVDSDLTKLEYPVHFGSVIRRFLAGDSCDAKICGSKTPQFTENMDSLHCLFPDAQFIIVVRDVRDIALSFQKKWGKDMLWSADKWNRRMCLARKVSRQFPEQVLFVKFEDLLDRTEGMLREVCCFLSLEFSERMLRHHEFTGLRDGKINYGQPLKSGNKQKWREQMRPSTVRRIEEVAWQGLKQFGYDVAFTEEPRSFGALDRCRGQLNDALAMLLVGNRAAENNSIGQRVKNVSNRIWRSLYEKGMSE